MLGKQVMGSTAKPALYRAGAEKGPGWGQGRAGDFTLCGSAEGWGIAGEKRRGKPQGDDGTEGLGGR